MKKTKKHTRSAGKLATAVTAALASLCLSQEAYAFRVMTSVNTLSPSRVSKADINSDIGYLSADGIWFLSGNSDKEGQVFTLPEWDQIVRRLGGPFITEDILRNSNEDGNTIKRGSLDVFRGATSTDPSAAMVYIEREGDGALVLKRNTFFGINPRTGQMQNITERQQAEELYKTSNGTQIPLIMLTRAYVDGPWKDAVEDAFVSPSVTGIAMEPTLDAILESNGPGIHNGVPTLIKRCISLNKDIYILMHTGGDYVNSSGGGTSPWTDANHDTIFSKLQGWLTTAELNSSHLVLVYQLYDINPINGHPQGRTHRDMWFGPNDSVRSAIAKARNHPNYTGNKP